MHCEVCNEETMHLSTSQFNVGENQTFLVVLLRRLPGQCEDPSSVADIETISFPRARATFSLAGGIVHYGRTPSSGHYCSFRRYGASAWLYTDDAVS